MSVRTDRTKHGKEVIVCDRRWPDGSRFRRVMATRDLAEELDAEITLALKRGTWRELRSRFENSGPDDPSVAEYADHYLEVYCKVRNKRSSYLRKKSSLKILNRHLGRRKLDALTRKDVYQYMASRKAEGVKSATINRDLSVLRHMYEFALDEEMIKKSPMARHKKLREPRAERPRATDRHFQKVARELSFPVLQLVTLIYETGCRPSEAMQLKWEHVDLAGRAVTFNLRKAGDNARVALTAGAIDTIKQIPRLPGCPFVFWNPKTGDRYQRINETFNRARDRAGLPWLQLKDFRRAVGIALAESGQPLHVAQAQLGHSSIRTTEQFYAHFSPEFAIERARDALEKRGRTTGGPGPEAPESSKTVSHEKSNVVNFQQFREG